WVKNSKNEQWIDSFENLKKGHKKYSEDEKSLLINYTVTGVTPFNLAVISLIWQRMSLLPDTERLPGFQERDKNLILSRLKNSIASYDPEVETAVFLNFCSINPQTHPLFEKSLKIDRKILQGQFQRTSTLKVKDISEVLTTDFIKKNESDPLFKYAKELEVHYFKYLQNLTSLKGFNQKFRVPYLQSLVKFLGKKYYPDANASPRVSFAHVAGYIPQEGVLHTPWTTISGLIAKETGRWPFAIPGSLRAVHSDTVKMTPFRDKNLLDIPACFLSNADTTGGNSGSPVLNASGALVGINFDRVYENIAGDFGYNPAYSRNISTDIRAILWYLKEVQKWPNVNELISGK
ncbi:S46 family peptidase, partial [Myxococcota bacterium]|nr:S46 family peptidase [Myxococcota bacterium]